MTRFERLTSLRRREEAAAAAFFGLWCWAQADPERWKLVQQAEDRRREEARLDRIRQLRMELLEGFGDLEAKRLEIQYLETPGVRWWK